MNDKSVLLLNGLIIWALALAVSLLLFYGLDHSIMAMQGLPLSWNLSPAQ